MKVSKVIEYLSDYGPNDEIMVAWFDRAAFDYAMDQTLPDNVWSNAVAAFDDSDTSEMSEICGAFVFDALNKQVSA